MVKDWHVVFGGIEKTGRHLNEGIFLGLILKGEILLEQNLQITVMPADSCFVINDGDIFGMESKKANLILGVLVSRAYLERECPESAACTFLCNSSRTEEEKEPQLAELKKGIAQMVFLYLGKKEGWQFLFRAELWRLFGCLYMNFLQGEETGGGLRGDEGRLQAILEFIRRNYRWRISLNELAEKAFLSPAYLSKLFHKEMGISFTRYLSALRLERSVRELLDTDHTILEIAMNHGFANVKAFNNQFRAVYHETPAAYRKKAGKEKREEEWFFLPENAGKETMDLLVRYLKTYSQDSGRAYTLREEIDAGKAPQGLSLRCARILNLGTVKQALRHDVRRQLEEVRRALDFQYVYVWRFIGDSHETNAYTSYLQFCDYYDLFDALHAGGWIPFLRIEMDELFDPAYFGGPKEALGYLKQLLKRLARKYERAWWSQWKFDIAGTGEQLTKYYAKICSVISKVMEGAGTGVCLDGLEGREWRQKENFLVQHAAGGGIAFLTFTIDQNLGRKGKAEAELFENYSCGLIEALKSFMRQNGGEGLKYYLLDWNTLAGRSHVENGEFHRSALLVDQILRNAAMVDGMGIRLNPLCAPEKERPSYATYFLSLFLYGQVKRPPFFIYQIFDMCGEQTLYRSNHVILSKDEDENYTLLIFNPQYAKPEEALENIGRELYKDSFDVVLCGLRAGHYCIRKMTLDKKNGSIYQGMSGIDELRSLSEVEEYLEHTVFPDITIYETEIKEEYHIHQNLLLNAVVFYTLKRFD